MGRSKKPTPAGPPIDPAEGWRQVLDLIRDTPGWQVIKRGDSHRITNPTGAFAKFTDPNTEQDLIIRGARLIKELGWDARTRSTRPPAPAPAPPRPAAPDPAAQAVSGILADTPFAASMLREAVAEQADPEPVERDGRTGALWQGHLLDALLLLWPELPAEPGNLHTARLADELLAHLAEEHLLHPHGRSPNGTPLWWVAGTENPNVKIYSCTQCSFASSSAAALTTHLNKLNGQPHPEEGAFACPQEGCHEVRPTATSFAAHARKSHGQKGRMCHSCREWFDDKASLDSHQNQAHGRRNWRKPHDPAAPAPQPAAPAAPAVLPAALEEALSPLRSLFDGLTRSNLELSEENGRLREENRQPDPKAGELNRELAELRAENERLSAENEHLKTVHDRMFGLLQPERKSA